MDKKIDHIILQQLRRSLTETFKVMPPEIRQIVIKLYNNKLGRWDARNKIVTSMPATAMSGNDVNFVFDDMRDRVKGLRQRFAGSYEKRSRIERHGEESMINFRATVSTNRPSSSINVGVGKRTEVIAMGGTNKHATLSATVSPAWQFMVNKIGASVCEGNRVIMSARKLAKLDEIVIYQASVLDCKSWISEHGYIAMWRSSAGKTEAIFNKSKSRALAMMKTKVSRMIFSEMNI